MNNKTITQFGFHNVAKYHLGKVKLERVGQRYSPTSVRDLRGSPRVVLRCIVALLAERRGSIFAFL